MAELTDLMSLMQTPMREHRRRWDHSGKEQGGKEQGGKGGYRYQVRLDS